MPWHLQETDGGYYVVDDKGKRYSAKPIPKWRATAQMRALYASEPGVTKKHYPGKHDQASHGNWASGHAAQPDAAAFNRSEWEGKDLKTRVEAWKAMDQRERDRLANAKEVIGARQKELLAEAGERPTLESAHGDTKHAIEMRLDSLKGVLSQESSDEINTIATGLDDLLGISGASPESRHALNMEVVDAIAAQEFEAMGRTLGDHGVPHISGNINFATEMLMQHPGEDRPEDMAAIIVANAFHDSGYLTEPSQIFLDEGHPRWSQEHYDANLRKTVSAALGDQTAAEVSHMIRTHADTSIDWQEDITGSAMRVADNTALFQKEKLPALFRLVPENVKVLQSLAEKQIDHVTAGKKMLENVSKSKLPTKVKSQLTHAAGEISPVSPKFILGMLGGYVNGFKWAGDHMVIYLKPDNQATIFQKVLDLGQRQFSKLAEAYGLDPQQFLKDLNFKLNDPRSGKTVFEGVILSEKERWRTTLEKLKEKHQASTTHKHYPGEHNQEAHGNRAGAATISAIQPGKLRETFENQRRADRPADQPAGSTDRPEWLLPTKAPEHIKNPNKRWVYEKLVGKINDINERVHILARDFRDSKDAGDWKYLKTLADQAANLIEERAPMLEMLESMAQIKLPIYVPSFSRVTPMGEKPREDPNKDQMGFGFKEFFIFKQIRKGLIRFKHLPGQHNQKRHGWRYGSIHGARAAARQGKWEWEEYKKRARSGSTSSKLPDDIHMAQIEIGRRVRKINKIKDPKERMQALDDLEAQQTASVRKHHGWVLQSRVIAAAKVRAREEMDKAPKEAPAIRGEKTKAFGADPNNSYEFQFKVVDMANLVPSNTKEGGINPDYDPALQPRDRSRAASQQQIDNIAKNLSPETLIYDFHRLDTGAPIVGPDNMVESGNGRVLAMERAKELYPERWDAYQQTMKNSLETYGINPDEVKGMTAPVLVRERLTKTDRAAFAKESNQAALLTMSPLEVAIQDAGRIKPDSLGRLVVDEDQNIDQALRSPKNVDFVRNFLGGIPDTERGALLRSDGSLNRMGLWRMKAAVFSKVFPGEAGQRISETFLESLDSSIKNFETAISGALPKLAQAESLIAGGRRNKKLSLVTDFSKAIDMLARLRESGTSVKDYVGQRGLFGSELNTRQMKLLNFFDGLSRSPKKLRNFFENYADSIVNATPSGQSNLFGSMFGGELSPEKLVDSLIQRSSQVEAPAAPAGQGGLFAHA